MKHFLSLFLSLLAFIACTSPEIPGQEETTSIPVQSVELLRSSLTLLPGEVATLTAKVIPDNATDKTLTWTSSNDAVATVSQSGEVNATAIGSCTVSVACGGKKADCEVTVTPIPVGSVSLDKTTASLLVGETLQLTATIYPGNASDQEVTWVSSDTGIVTVENGLITALNAGEATITATAGGCSAECKVSVSVPFSYGGMCMEAVGGGIIVIDNPNQLTIDFKREDREWTSTHDGSISIYVDAGERVWFRGHNETYTFIDENGASKETVFSCYNDDFYLYGNLMSLIYGDDYEFKTEITGDYTFCKLFYQNDHIINHPSLDIELLATTLSPSCYRIMFYGCSKLSRAPKLPAKILTEACYASMFAYCTSLKEFPEMAATDMAYMSCTWMMMGSGIEVAPELPAMNLARSCYEFMFMECPNLKKAMSVLPATELAATCYTGMFQRAEKLETAPKLPATELKYSCYSHMFNGCKSLDKAPELPAMSLAEACYQRMFGNSGLLEAPELPAMDMEVMCYQYMFEGSQRLEKAPVLPALQLNYFCYENMFHDCSSLNYVNAAYLTTPSSSYTRNWLDGVASEGTFVKNPKASWSVSGPNGVPEGWTIQ